MDISQNFWTSKLILLAEPTLCRYFKKWTSRAWVGNFRRGGGGGRAHSSHLPSQRFWHSGILTLEIKLALHWWEASARSQLLHPCSLLLSNCKIISTLIITLECNNYMLHCNNWYSKMKLNNFIIPLYCCDSKSNFCAGFFFALKWNKLQWAEYLVESMTCNICLWCQYASLVSICMCGKCNGSAFINECNRTNSILKNQVPSHALCELYVM